MSAAVPGEWDAPVLRPGCGYRYWLGDREVQSVLLRFAKRRHGGKYHGVDTGGITLCGKYVAEAETGGWMLESEIEKALSWGAPQPMETEREIIRSKIAFLPSLPPSYDLTDYSIRLTFWVTLQNELMAISRSISI